MPTDSAGNYSLPPSYLATPGTTIRAEQHNAPLQDIAQGLSDRLMRDGRNGMVGQLNMGSFKIANVAPGENASDVATVSQASVPIGSVIDYAGSSVPVGWLLCAGQPLSRAAYSELFAVIGTTYGAPDGSSFNLPDYRGCVSAGRDNMDGADAQRLSTFYGAVARTLGGILGTASHILSIAQMPSHNHGGSTTAAGSHSHTAQNKGVKTIGGAGGSEAVGSNANIDQTTSEAGNHQHAIGGQGGNEAHPNAQPTIITNKIIKVSL